MKVDVEGMEAEVLTGAQRLLSDIRPVWIVEANPDALQLTAQVMRTFLDSGYRLHWLLTPFVSPFPFRGGPTPRSLIDLNFVALSKEHSNIWSLPEIASPSAPWVLERDAYPYFAAYEKGRAPENEREHPSSYGAEKEPGTR